MLRLLFFLPALAAAFPGLEPRVCGDNCARAVIASAFTTRQGAADCSSYLLTTVTPATSTITETSTLSFTPVETISSTQTSTTTTIIPVTVGITVPGIATVTVTSTTTVTSNWPKSEMTYYKRDQTSAPSVIPAYASPCSGAARYTTACACVGVFPTTITVAAPLTTTTTYVSVSQTSTATEIIAVETETATATTTVTSLIPYSTTTVTAVATATLSAFRLRVSGGDYNNRNVYKPSTSNGITLTSTSSSSVWTLNTTTNELIDVQTGFSVYTWLGNPYAPASLQVLSKISAKAGGRKAAVCSVDASSGIMELHCDQANTNNNIWVTQASTSDETLMLASDVTSLTSYSSALTLQFVGVDGNVY